MDSVKFSFYVNFPFQDKASSLQIYMDKILIIRSKQVEKLIKYIINPLLTLLKFIRGQNSSCFFFQFSIEGIYLHLTQWINNCNI